MTDSTYPLFPVVAFLGFLLPLIPLPWHLQALNSGTSYYIFWSSLACLNLFVNSTIWSGNALNPAPFWCEISIRIMMAASVGIPASSLCINRRLYHIASLQAASITPAEASRLLKRRSILIDSLICLLFPLLYVALQYVVQGHRFNIFEDIGCYPALYNTLLTFFISSMWPLALGLISAVYCVMTLRLFARRRAEFGHLLASNTTMTISRYFRLMALAMTEICATTPLSIFMIYLNATANPVGPWRSWEDTHFDYSRIEQIPAIIWRSNHLLAIGMEFSIWVTPVCSFIFFAFFGFAQESRKNYRRACCYLKKLIPVSESSPAVPLKVMP
ncbi:putative fungal pheromoneG-protein-coupled receptor [Gymnopilus junonius]|uniref:Fungal pheromoneG-protein-coupled receptor n=1 Tax=Gymnopilus junonius TaxID=109634 RepID=A0A9P5NKG6_GYMJU|nr:putative fungal pheromoneG-protein-coupled receptor [Gymnopilus junonius]